MTERFTRRDRDYYRENADEFDRYGGTQYGSRGDYSEYGDYGEYGQYREPYYGRYRSPYFGDYRDEPMSDLDFEPRYRPGHGEPGDYQYEHWMTKGPYTGYGPQGYQRSDERIHDEISDRLMQHGRLDARTILVEVKDGEVTLTGKVGSRHAKRMAEDTAESVMGVKDVHNRLQVDKELERHGRF